MTKVDFISKEKSIPPDTDRLTFRFLSKEDIEEWKKFIISEKATEFFTFPREEDQSKLWIERQLKRYADGSGGLMAVCLKKDGALLGQCGLLYQELQGNFDWEVGYSFLPEHWGKGYATEAARACFEHGFAIGLADSLISIIHQDNVASQRVVERSGLKLWKTTVWKNLPVQVWRITKDSFQKE